ncbi:MAG: hypothetical protein HN353_09345 [Bdellovibrionales bacterium]|jgi:hypothetical protein|nr:hypothetical protein [Bdellovibrionales bacterium]MBT3527337.1 hypothetical protein [Bdellovibrionales bacterium]MBT7668032.1 hypothetical protein [Bdellovibrionales bacterium]MBT7767303.1 hypothetical protein [Bdellovibrionales bacterium]
MRNRFTLFLLLFFIVATPVISFGEVNSLERANPEVECSQELQRCTYVTQNLNARELVTKLKAIMFPQTVPTAQDGYIYVESLKKINFWFFDQAMLDRFVGLIPLLDSFEDFNPTALVQLTTEIYAVTQEGLSQLEISLSSAVNGLSGVSLGALSLIANSPLSIGTNALSVALSGQRSRQQLSRISVVNQLISNYGNISFKHKSKVYISPNSVTTKEEEAGVEIRGEVSINRHDSNYVLLKNYSFFYGIINPSQELTAQSPVTSLEFSFEEMYLTEGLSRMMVSSNFFEVGSSRGGFFDIWNRGRNAKKSKLLVVTRARTFSFDEFMAESRRLSELTLYNHFNQNDIATLSDREIPIKEVFNSLTPYSYLTHSGERVLGFRLDRKLATSKNYKREIKIKVKGGGMKMLEGARLDRLMLSGLKFDDFAPKYLSKYKIKINVTLTEELPSGRGASRKITLEYNPKENRFLHL